MTKYPAARQAPLRASRSPVSDPGPSGLSPVPEILPQPIVIAPATATPIPSHCLLVANSARRSAEKGAAKRGCIATRTVALAIVVYWNAVIQLKKLPARLVHPTE